MDAKLLEEIKQRSNKGSYTNIDTMDAVMDRIMLIHEIERLLEIIKELENTIATLAQ